MSAIESPAIQQQARGRRAVGVVSPKKAPAAVITGFGLVTPLGGNGGETWEALLAGRYVADHARIDTPGRPRVVAMALDAAREAWRSGDRPDEADVGGTAVVVGTSKGPVQEWLETAGGAGPEGISQIAAAVAGELKLDGPLLTLSAACASGLHALVRGTMLVRARECRRAIVVAAEASVHPLFLGNFQRLGVFPRAGHGCRPFDRERDGFLMSEAAAAVVLEASADPADGDEIAGSQARIMVDRFCLTADATHLTASDPDAKALRHAMNQAIGGRPLDLVHAHGTGTLLNDAAELSAIEASLPAGRERPLLYSHKGALGHSLGAAGLVAVVLNCLCHRTGKVPGNVRTSSPLSSDCVEIPRDATRHVVSRSLAVAAGFGGPVAAVSLMTRRPSGCL